MRLPKTGQSSESSQDIRHGSVLGFPVEIQSAIKNDEEQGSKPNDAPYH